MQSTVFNARVHPELERFALASAGGAVLGSLLVLVGWASNNALLKGLIPGLETAKPLEALAFLLAGAGILLLRSTRAPLRISQILGRGFCAGLVALLGGLVVVEYGAGIDLGIDRWLFHRAVMAETGPFPGRPALVVALCLLAVGLALMAIRSRGIGVDLLAVAVFFTALFVLIGYLYGALPFYQPGLHRPVPLLSALLLMLVSMAYLCARPAGTLLDPILTMLAGGVIARRLLVAAVLIPLGLEWLRLVGQHLGLYELDIGLALLVTLNILVFAGLIFWNAVWLNEAHAALQQSEERFRSLVNATPGGLMMVAPDGRIMLANAAAENLFACRPGQLVGETLERLVPERFRAGHPALCRAFMAEGRPRPMGAGRDDLFALRQNGEEFPVEISLTPLKTSEGSFILVSIEDITERKHIGDEIRSLNASLEQRVAERTQQLAFERSRWQGIVEGMVDEVWTCDARGRMSLLNLDAATPMGLNAFHDQSVEEVYQTVEIFFPDGRPRPPEDAPLLRSLRGEIVRGEEIMRHRHTGVQCYRQFSSAPLHDASGAISGAVAIVRDITEQKRAEEGLRRFELLSASSKDILLFIRRENGQILDVNRAAIMAYGYSRDELLALTLRDLRAPEARGPIAEQMARADGEGILFETVHLRKDGSTFPVEVSSQGATLNGMRTLVSIVRDITERKQAEAKQAYLASFPEKNPNPIIEVDFTGQVLYANAAALRAYPDLFQRGSAHPCLAGWNEVIAFFRDGRKEILTRDIPVGKSVFQQSLQCLAQEHLIRMYGTDITARKWAEDALRAQKEILGESEQRLNRAQEMAHLGSWELDVINDRLSWSDEVYRIFGLQPQEFGASYQAFLEAVHPEERAAVNAAYFGSMQAGRDGYELEHRIIRHSNGEVRFVLEKCEHFRDESGQVVRSLGMVHDITERKRAEQALQESQSRLETVFAAIPHVILEYDEELRPVRANRAALDALGLTTMDFSRDWAVTQLKFTTLDGRAIRREDLPTSRALHGETVSDELYAVTTADGAQRIISAYAAPLYRAGKVTGVVALWHDITERKRAEEEMRRSQQLLQAIIDNSQALIYVKDLEGRILIANQPLAQAVNQDVPAILGKTSYDIVASPQDATEHMANDRHVAETGQSIVVEEFSPGHVFLSVKFPLRDAQGQIFAVGGVSTDITERKRVEEQLRYQAALLSNVGDAVVASDAGFCITAWNAAAESLYGWKAEEVLGRNGVEIVRTEWPDQDAEEMRRMIAEKGQWRGEAIQVRRDGTRFPVEVSSIVLSDEKGKITGYISTNRDITERKRAEEQLSAALEEKEVLLKEIHHRVKNNLQVISSLLRLQAATLSDPHIRELFADSQRRVRAMALVHEQLYQAPSLAQINFKDYIYNLVNSLRRSYSHLISSVEIRVTVDEIIIEMDQAMPLGLLINELVSNSLKYAFPADAETRTGTIWILARREPDGTLTVIVGDNGVGLAEEVNLEHPPSMGLQLVTSFVTQLQGQLSVQRKPGTIFTVSIPERKG